VVFLCFYLKRQQQKRLCWITFSQCLLRIFSPDKLPKIEKKYPFFLFVFKIKTQEFALTWNDIQEQEREIGSLKIKFSKITFDYESYFLVSKFRSETVVLNFLTSFAFDNRSIMTDRYNFND
jgi:hypothetical protein